MPDFAVVIPTHNRAKLVVRAIDSIWRQTVYPSEVIVVDDASTDNTEHVVRAQPGVRYIRLTKNGGPGGARNAGLLASNATYVIMLDDDDELRSDALATVLSSLESLGSNAAAPVIQFACDNMTKATSFVRYRLDDYLAGRHGGDYTPVIHREQFLGCGYRYPSIRVGAEHLLWWKVADQHGIPTFFLPIVDVSDDAPVRLTSAHNQIERAAEYAALQEETISVLRTLHGSDTAALVRTKHLGAAVYWSLAGRRLRALPHLRELVRLAGFREVLAASVAVSLPRRLLRAAYHRLRGRG